MLNAWCALALAMVMLECLVEWHGWARLRFITKPGAMLAIIVWFSLSGGWARAGVWFGLGMLASLIGDALLLNKRLFLPGIAAFFMAHLAYIFGFNQTPLPLQGWIFLPIFVVGAVYFIVACRVRGKIWNRLKKSRLAWPVLAYSIILSLMLISGLLTFLRPAWPLNAALSVALGAGLFFISDIILAFNLFVRPLRRDRFIGMLPYLGGQFFLATGVLIQLAVSGGG